MHIVHLFLFGPLVPDGGCLFVLGALLLGILSDYAPHDLPTGGSAHLKCACRLRPRSLVLNDEASVALTDITTSFALRRIGKFAGRS